MTRDLLSLAYGQLPLLGRNDDGMAFRAANELNRLVDKRNQALITDLPQYRH